MTAQEVQKLFPKGVIVQNGPNLTISYRDKSDEFYVEELTEDKKPIFLALVKLAKEFAITVEYESIKFDFVFGNGKSDVKVIPAKEKSFKPKPYVLDESKIDEATRNKILELTSEYDINTEEGLGAISEEFIRFLFDKQDIIIPNADKVANFNSLLKTVRELHQAFPMLEVDVYEPDNHGYDGSVEFGIDIEALKRQKLVIPFSYKAKDLLEKLLTLCSMCSFEFSPGLAVLTMIFHS